MAMKLSLYVICNVFFVAVTIAEPEPGRVPKVYNALITSNQNLEPSKAFPVYQPVLTNAAIPFPYQPVFYGDLPLSNGLLPAPALIPNPPIPSNNVTPAPSSAPPKDTAPSENTVPPATSSPPSDTEKPATDSDNTNPPPPPPNTESPIPLNEFGLPPQILPLGRIPAGFEFPQYNPFSYSYPNYRFYDPSFNFGYQPFSPWPVYGPVTNFVGQYAPSSFGVPPTVNNPPAVPKDQTTKIPPSEPSDLNVYNYPSKDPSIPDVPPPPVPQGGLRPDKEQGD